MATLTDKIRKARESEVEWPAEAGPVKFTIRRPTNADMIDFGVRAREAGPRLLLQYVIGWSGVTEGHMLIGGDPHPLKFDPEALYEWVSDDMPLYNCLLGAILDAHSAAQKARDAAEKN